MNQEFKFKVGDLLTTTAIREGMKGESGYVVHVPAILTVIECIRQQCSGGEQLSYGCRCTTVGHRASIVFGAQNFQECELTADLSSVELAKKHDGS